MNRSSFNIEPHVLLSASVAVPPPYFNTSQRIASLAAEARRWLGTPWCANSEARGPRGGVSCHNLPRALFVAIGAISESFPRIQGHPNRHARQSIMEPFLDARPELVRVAPEGLAPGDLIGLRLCHCTDHLGVVLDRQGHFIHVLMHKLVTIDSLTQDPTWSKRLMAAWRLVQ